MIGGISPIAAAARPSAALTAGRAESPTPNATPQTVAATRPVNGKIPSVTVPTAIAPPIAANEVDATESASTQPETGPPDAPAAGPTSQNSDAGLPPAARPRGPSGQIEFTPDEQAALRQLQHRDREVRAHEQAHAAAGAGIAGAPSYTYVTGPDGRQYAVGGEVSISVNTNSSDPRQAIRQLEQVVRAALAPAQPSGQDRSVAAQASAQIGQLRAQVLAESQAAANERIRPADSNEADSAQPSERPALLGADTERSLAVERRNGEAGAAPIIATAGPIEPLRSEVIAAYQPAEVGADGWRQPRPVPRLVNLAI